MSFDIHGHGCVRLTDAIAPSDKSDRNTVSFSLHPLLNKIYSITNSLLESSYVKRSSENFSFLLNHFVFSELLLPDPETSQIQNEVQEVSDVAQLESAILDGKTLKALELIEKLSPTDLVSKDSDAPLETADFLGHREIFLAIFEKLCQSESEIDYARKFINRSFDGKGLLEIFFERNIEVARVLAKSLSGRDLYLLINQSMQTKKDEKFIDFLIDSLPDEFSEPLAKTLLDKYAYLNQPD